MANDENKRAAAGILTNLSGFVITACLTMLAIEGGLIAFVLGNRIVGYAYYSLSVLAFVAFVISVVLGGLGITRTAEEIARDQWKLSIGSSHFNAQAGLAFAGLVLFLVSCFLATKPIETETQRILINLQTSIENTTQSNLKQAEQLQALSQKVTQLEADKRSAAEMRGRKAKRRMRNGRRRAIRGRT